MGKLTNSRNMQKALGVAMNTCDIWHHEFLTPEHVLYAIAQQPPFAEAMASIARQAEVLSEQMENFFPEMEEVPQGIPYNIEGSEQFGQMMSLAVKQAQYAEVDVLDVPHIVSAMLMLDDSEAHYRLAMMIGGAMGEFMAALSTAYEDSMEVAGAAAAEDSGEKQPWRQFVTCLNDTYTSHNPLIGREDELERTIQVLCRKDKNNPLHIGESGVGKTALVYGLTAMVERGDVPGRLRGARIYMMDMGTMVAGTQFRGDFEKRMKQVMEGLAQEGNTILYIDEMHNLVGAGRSGGDASLDASNMLKPYLEGGRIRFIGSTTYDEYNRYMAKSKSLVRRFQQIDIAEPSEADAVKILDGLKKGYETFHGVKYAAGTMEYAVHQTARHITDRFLPDKAIDLIDEAGAYRETHPLKQKRQTVDRRLIADILAKMCKIDAAALREQGNASLATLEADIRSEIFGQDKAVQEVVQAVQMAKAGLADEGKPMASLLFVGPTGVGKTEVARVLSAQEPQLRAALRRDRKGASRHLQHLPADNGLRLAHRQPWAEGRLPQRDSHNDFERRSAVCLACQRGLRRQREPRRGDARHRKEDIQARIHQPPHRHRRLPRHGPRHGVAHPRQESGTPPLQTCAEGRAAHRCRRSARVASEPRLHQGVRRTRTRPCGEQHAETIAHARNPIRQTATWRQRGGETEGRKGGGGVMNFLNS